MNASQSSNSSLELNQAVLKKMNNRLLMSFFIGAKIPLAWAAGVRIESVTADSCAISLPYGWRSQNPFKSIYFAAQAMAAEMSTGMLGELACQSAPASIAMLVVGMEAEFVKKANKRTTFVSEDGPAFFEAIAKTMETGEPVTVEAVSEGKMPDGTVVARFKFTWSFKKRSRQ